MAKPQPGGRNQSAGLSNWLGRDPKRALIRLAIAIGGVWVAAAVLTIIWPKPDQLASQESFVEDNSYLAPLPKKPITVLLIGIDANQINDASNQAAPLGAANADSIMLIQFAANQPVQVLQLPNELGINLPGNTNITSLADSYREGGVALIADVIKEIIDIQNGGPHRYLVMSRQALRTLVDGIGQVEITLSQPYQKQDKSQGYLINLQAGRQSLNGIQAEHLARYRINQNGDVNRRKRQKLLILAISEQLRQPGTASNLITVINELSEEIQTDLTRKEMLSLFTAALTTPSPPVLQELPLAPRAGNQQMRQLKKENSRPRWP